MCEMPSEPGSVTRAIREAQHGEGGTDAAAQLMRRYYAVVISKANRRLRGVVVADASDVAIDVFDSIFKGLAKGRYTCKDREDFEELLGKVTYHKAISLYHWIKTARRHPAVKQSTEEILASYPVKESHRRVAELYYLCGKSEAEVATELQISLKTVQESLNDVRCWLQRHRYRPTACETQDAIEKRCARRVSTRCADSEGTDRIAGRFCSRNSAIAAAGPEYSRDRETAGRRRTTDSASPQAVQRNAPP